jgi:DNA polymerase I-like protein with 3'-5' exonuclease and polymerase domains
LNITHLTRTGELTSWLLDSCKEGADTFALDLETTGLAKHDKVISGAVTGPTENEVAFFGPELLSELLEAPDGSAWIFHNASFDLRFLSWNGVRLQDRFVYHDTLILSHLLDENGEHGLGYLVRKYYDDNYKEEFWGKYKKAQDAPVHELAEYNAKDVSYTHLLHGLLRDALVADGVPGTLVEHVHSLQRSLLETEINGIAVDRDYLMQKGVELKTRIEGLLPRMRQSVADEISIIECDEWIKEIEKRRTPVGRGRVLRPSFSFDSSKQLAVLLYDKIGLEKQYNEKTKNLSVDWDSLEKLKDEHPLIEMIQDYREAQKIYGTYIEGTLERMVEGRIYPSFNVAGTATGRISHSNPNMGNMPRDGGIRGIFVPDPDHVFVSADFSQLEVSLSAHFTRDENLLRICEGGVSQHDITAASLGIPRGLAKTVNFGMQYGCSHFKVAKVLGVSNEKGKEAYDKYWETYSGQKSIMDECAAKVDRGEPIISPFGRRRRFEVRSRKSWDSAYRQAWNALVQGTGSDCTSRAFYNADKNLRELGIGRALFTVHDEIVIQAKTGHAEEAQKILLETMSAVGEEIGLTVKLKAEGSGPMERWFD